MSVSNISKTKNVKVKIFVGYYQQNTIFESDVYQPINTSNSDWIKNQNVISDSEGENISDKNCHYAELSGHYWIWKNFLKTTAAEYIGYCHYRRFLDFSLNYQSIIPFKPIYASDFMKTFKQYTQDKILEVIDNNDIILPQKLPLGSKVYEQYAKYHPIEDFELALKILTQLYPDYRQSAFEVLTASEMYTCLHFVMKKELFAQYAQWMFSILFELEKQSHWQDYTDYLKIRTPAYIAERFFNIWVHKNAKEKNLNIKNITSVLLIGNEYGNENPKLYMENYRQLVDSLTN